jgi:predicted nucleic acid-binding protein
MKNTTLDIRTYSFAAADQLFFDANIWLYIYGPQRTPADWKSALYSRALSYALSAGSGLFVDVLVISEFINRYARLEHQVLLNTAAAADFKQFRNSPNFKPIAQTIAGNVRRIMQHSRRVGSDFESLDIAALVSEYEIGSSDFNDQVLASLCRSRGFSLVTHDIDFNDRGLNVITANKHLMAQRNN